MPREAFLMQTSPLLPKLLSKKPEDMITEVLAWLLRSPESSIPVLLLLFPNMGISEPPSNVITQYSKIHGIRPDLLLQWPNRNLYLEIKLWAPLTEAQQQVYQAVLAEDPQAEPLYFLIPAIRQNRIEQEVTGPHAFVFWDDFYTRLKELLKRPILQGKARFWAEELAASIQTEVLFGMNFQPLPQNLIDVFTQISNPSAFSQLLHLIDALEQTFRADIPQYPSSTRPYGEFKNGLAYGFEFAVPTGFPKMEWIWFGFWIQYWLKHPEYPLWLVFKSLEDISGEPLEEFPVVYRPSVSTVAIPLPLKAGWEAHQYAQELKRIWDLAMKS